MTLAPLTDPETRADQLRLLEALLFAAAEPLRPEDLAPHFPPGTDLDLLLTDLARHYAGRGVELVRRGEAWAFRTAADLAPRLTRDVAVPRRLTRAQLETLAVIAYHQPVTRAEIEAIRGVATARTVLEPLLASGWVAPGGRREAPGRPLTWVTTVSFLDAFGLPDLASLPQLQELRALGLLDPRAAGATPSGATPPGASAADDE